MTRLHPTALLLLGAALMCLGVTLVRAQQFHESASSQRTPLVARFIERDHTWTQHGLPETLEFTGLYLISTSSRCLSI